MQSQGLLLSLQSLFQSDGELVGAAGGLAAAADAAQTLDSLLNAHALDELGNALQVTVAAAHEIDGLDDVALQLDIDASGASAAGHVSICHFSVSLNELIHAALYTNNTIL